MTEPATPIHYTGHLIRRAQQVHVAAWVAHVSRDVSSVQFAALTVLEAAPGASQAELGTQLDLDRSTIADLVARMVRNDLIAREADPGDRRRKMLTLTGRGSEVLRTLRPRVESIETIVTGGLGEADRAELRRLLTAIVSRRD
ncbi:MarR family transcriptional regulator [Microbacterium sp. G2-8]|uniref:MarR family winged helix-turn-helix transcriptional regulator n=1 Tax=Microbacterium sp. G2-8 TaxID=2842454 RepID=UPI001C8A7561|nr:MarR family transcriptional regulator [Microbacterium sp. G2-8]